ncbi:MAG: TlyA family RNA methyltransferase [Oscillospiraceae bacterium]|nr:TlyA family RNA methyltransferase [Oscillospiraceae bacterium]
MASQKKIRADELLFLQGKAESRSQAKILIMAGKVRSGPDSLISKPAQMLPENVELFVESPPRFVSRGGEKLAGAIEEFKIPVTGKHALDIGASTGGFTDCLLQNGAESVTCVDVGHGQLHAKLRNDSRVTNLEKVNARQLDNVELPRATYDLVVGDLSFISLKMILVPAWNRVEEGGSLVMLIKPQFEATREEVSKTSGIIKDPSIHDRVVREILEFAKNTLPGFSLLGLCDSPIRGGDGNKEFLFYAGKFLEK